MRIAMVITPMNDSNLRLARQIGVTDVVGRCPGKELHDVVQLRDRVAAAGMQLTVIEGQLPLKSIVLGLPDRDRDVEFIRTLIRSMGAAGVPVLCYNFMSTGDMTRSRFDVTDRGGALVNRFDAAEFEQCVAAQAPTDPPISAAQMWGNLESFLREIVPEAERTGVKLAMHPDDPPGLARLHGQPRIMGSVDEFERLVALVPSPVNGICFCQGCFSEMGIDVIAAIHRLGPFIHYVHFRDVIGCTPSFRETFHDCGQTNMAAAMWAYRDINYGGVMRPDHVPVLEGESGDASGYTMQGRLFAVGYMRGLMHGIETDNCDCNSPRLAT